MYAVCAAERAPVDLSEHSASCFDSMLRCNSDQAGRADAACEALCECCEYAGSPLIASIQVALTSTKDLWARADEGAVGLSDLSLDILRPWA